MILFVHYYYDHIPRLEIYYLILTFTCSRNFIIPYLIKLILIPISAYCIFNSSGTVSSYVYVGHSNIYRDNFTYDGNAIFPNDDNVKIRTIPYIRVYHRTNFNILPILAFLIFLN